MTTDNIDLNELEKQVFEFRGAAGVPGTIYNLLLRVKQMAVAMHNSDDPAIFMAASMAEVAGANLRDEIGKALKLKAKMTGEGFSDCTGRLGNLEIGI